MEAAPFSIPIFTGNLIHYRFYEQNLLYLLHTITIFK